MDLPVSFADHTRLLLGDEEYNKLADALNGEQPVSIRLNEEKTTRFFIQSFFIPLPGVCPGLPQDFISTVG